VLYAEFRYQLEDALQEAGLFFHGGDSHVETIDLADTARRWKVYVFRAALRSVEPFHVSAEISFYWTPTDAARAHTCEENLLTELLGRRKRPVGLSRGGSGWTSRSTQVSLMVRRRRCRSPACSAPGLLLLKKKFMRPSVRSRKGTGASRPSSAGTGTSTCKRTSNPMASLP